MAVYHPGCLARIFVPNVGTAPSRTQQENLDDVTQLQVRVHRVRLESNNLNEADECEIAGAYDDLGIDPRFLRNAELYLHLGECDDAGNFTPTADNLRFVGIACDVERLMGEGEGKDVRIRALDYTTLFLTCKQFSPQGIPDLSQTLRDAWRRICKYTGYFDPATRQVVSTVARLSERLRIMGSLTDPGPTLGKAVSSRLAKIGKLQVKSGADAWAVWQTAVGSLGLVSFIRGDECIVTTATDFYTADDPPRLVWGKNVQKLQERRDVNALSGKNVCLISFDPLLGRTIEAYYPPLDQAKPQKKLGASALGPGVVARAQDYEVFQYDAGCTIDAATLGDIARRVWEERSRQELAGEATTAEMFVDTLSGQSFDMLKLRAGDRIRIEIDRDALTQIQALDSLGARMQALHARGYSHDMALFIASNLDAISKVPPEFQVHSVSTELDTTSPPGRYEVVVRFLNRIDVSGAGQQGTGTGTPPITGQKDTTDGRAQKRRDGAAA